jgi:predicted ArsR family transcriptional regulator
VDEVAAAVGQGLCTVPALAAALNMEHEAVRSALRRLEEKGRAHRVGFDPKSGKPNWELRVERDSEPGTDGS